MEGDERRQWITEQFKKGMGDLGRELVDNLNVMGCLEEAAEGLTNGIMNTHRYLQGEFWQTMINVMKKYGDSPYFDARNEWAVHACKRMAQVSRLSDEEWEKMKEKSNIKI